MARFSRRGFLAAGAAGVTGAAACVPVGTAVEPGAPRQGVLREPARDVEVIAEYDVCVVGGSCTGVFAAVAASRLGAKTCVIENLGFFGGVATASLVNVWHSKYDTAGKRQILAGLTTEVIDRLKKRDAVLSHKHNQSKGFTFNSAELILELDALITEAKVTPYLHTRFVAPLAEGGKLEAVIIEDKTGRRAIRARRFIDASGDGDVAHRMGIETYKDAVLQPPTVCAIMVGLDAVRKQNPGFNLGRVAFNTKYPEALKGGFLWSADVPGLPGARMVAGTRVHGADVSDAEERTAAEIEGRRQVRAMMDLVRSNFRGGDELGLAALPARIGIRESRHVRCLHTLTENEVLTGARFEDAVVNGSYRVDVHHPDKPGLTFRYLDGTEVYVSPTGGGKRGRWRDKTDTDPTFYQVPYRSLVPKGATNLLVAGRCLDADRGAFGAVRVMVNCNQMGQAAGTAAYLSLDADTTVDTVDVKKLRKTLEKEGAIVI
jgi:hypothetical protein